MDVRFGTTESTEKSLGLAFQFAENALSKDASNCLAHIVLSSVYLVQRKHDKAVIEAKLAVERFPNDPGVINQFGVNLMLSGRLDEAISQFNRTSDINPLSEPFGRLGAAYRWKGDYEKSISLLKKI